MYEKTFSYRHCSATIFLIAINIIVYICCTCLGEMVYNISYGIGCMDAERVLLDGEYYRMVTSLFMHGGIEHIVSNMIFLAALGEMLEKALGHFRFALLYMLSGICGNIFSIAQIVLSGERHTSVGASGAVFGLIGALLIIVIINNGRYREISIHRMVLAIIYMVSTGMSAERIDNAAHLGGLISGILIMAAMYAIEVHLKEVRVR